MEISKLFYDIADPILHADLLRYLYSTQTAGSGQTSTPVRRTISKWIPKEYANRTNFVVGIKNDHNGDAISPGVSYTVQLAQYAVLTEPGHVVMARLIARVCGKLREMLHAKDAINDAVGSDPENQNQDSRDRGSAPELHLNFEQVMRTTGPFPFTAVLMEYISEQTGEDYIGRQLTALSEPKLIGDILVLPLDSFGWMPQLHTVEESDPIGCSSFYWLLKG